MKENEKLIVRVYYVIKKSAALAQASCSYMYTLVFWVYKYFMFVWTGELEHKGVNIQV